MFYALFSQYTRNGSITYERWGLKDGEGNLRIETSAGE
jgi:hypothetical protein